jgi:hypothetical protein
MMNDCCFMGQYSGNQYEQMASPSIVNYSSSESTDSTGKGFNNFTMPFGNGMVNADSGDTVEMPPMGISSSEPWAEGYSANPANDPGEDSPFVIQTNISQNTNPDSFDEVNLENPTIGLPSYLNSNFATMGTSPYTSGSTISMMPMNDSSNCYEAEPDLSYCLYGNLAGQIDNFQNRYNSGTINSALPVSYSNPGYENENFNSSAGW